MNIRILILLVFTIFAASNSASSQQLPVTPNYVVPIHGHGQFVSTPYGRIYYEREGQGPPIFLVAGGPGGSHASFHPWFSRLAATHTVIYFDNIGRGRSDRLKNVADYTVVRDADDIENLRKALGFKTITVLGHSYGGMPALAYGLKYPATTDHLILSDTLLNAQAFQMNIDNCNRECETRFPLIWAQLTELRKEGVKTGSDKYENLYGPTVDDLYWYNPDNESKMFHSGDKLDGANNAVYLAMIGDEPEWSVTGTMHGYDPSKKMKSCTIPTLICVGRYDRVTTLQIAQMIKDALPAHTSRLAVFEKSGHRPWIEQPDLYFQTVLNFLDGSRDGG